MSNTSPLNNNNTNTIYQQQLKEYEKLFIGRNFQNLRKLAVTGKLKSCPIRSLIWKFFLGCLPSDVDLKEWPNILNVHRKEYNALRSQYMIDPHNQSKELDIKISHPLSQHEDSPWTQFFQNAELEKEINQDIDRTYPESEFFQRKEVKEIMLRILFIYARQTPQLSYKQGMHEILAPIVYLISRDAVDINTLPNSKEELALLLNQQYIEHDSFTVFSHLMKTLKEWFVNESSKSRKLVSDDEVSPIVIKCRFIQNHILREKDPELFAHLQHLNVEPQLYMLRWVRLLLAREFHLEDVLTLWDALFGYSSDLKLIDYICTAMLIYIRSQLLNSDYTNCMRRLFKYPPVEDVYLFIEKGKYYLEVPHSSQSSLHQSPLQSISSSLNNNNNGMDFPRLNKLNFVDLPKVTIFGPQEDPHSEKIKQFEAKIEDLKTIQTHMGHRLERLIYSLQKEILENNQNSLNNNSNLSQNTSLSSDSVLVALAELKHIKDILMGLLPNVEDENK